MGCTINIKEMNYQEKRIIKRITLARDYLNTAQEQLESIRKDDRTDDTDRLLNTALDNIFEATEALKKIECPDNIYVGENIRVVMRHRKKKQ